MISSLAINIDQLNINCETISNFNQKFELKSASSKENNFFYEDPLLLTKSKDLDNFYINENITSTKNDLSLLYSKKLLLDIHSNSPLNRVIKIIEKSSPKKPQFSDMFKNNYNNLTERNYSNNNMITKNIIIENQSLSDRNINIFRNKQKINTPKYPDINTINPEEIKQLKKYNKSIKKLLKGNVPDRTYTQKNLNILKYSSLFNNNGRNSCKKNEKKRSIKVYSQSNDKKANSKNNAVSSSKNLKNILPKKQIKIDLLKLDDMSNNNIYKDIDKYLPKRSKLQKTIKKKILKMKQLKGSIHIQNIYKDLVKTKETIHEYEKERQPKFKYLYSLFNDKNLLPFQKEEKENLNIKKLDRDLFWTVNEFHNN
jgi:hypothetical protein